MARTHKAVGKWIAAVTFGLFATTSVATAAVDLVGLNIAGAEFTSSALPGKAGTHYFFPSRKLLETWNDKGIQTIRFPIKWERLQPKLNKDFDPGYAGLIDKLFTDAAASGIDVLLDVHNYARYRDKAIGTSSVPFSAFRDLNERIAKRWGNRSALIGYDIMNEPYGSADKYWPKAAQAGIDGIRKHDRQTAIYIEGMSYASAERWNWHGDKLLSLDDPIDNLVFSAHVYLDPDGSGTYKKGPASNLDPMIGVKRVEPFVKWLKKNYKRGHIGELGAPSDPKWMKAMDNTLAYLQKNCIPVTYWAAGPSWGKNKLSVEPNKDGSDKPQWKVLKKYVGQGNCSVIGPTP
ncbi:glycoside hydrolase family 5 protein [Pseudomonas sp. gcc21]|uniref:glycoside hydrolase family 5 protein n=1 Tax=Pseudomonas sp. gcc21 TaxID=2726989 RepID=UPI0014524F8D|nr:glycoside hydrolase family 5 protein [Pseudomonas sp. gcc21]QJD58030.1 glycoside hydrolase family 5 protein [Pseudomonas sp. gcc21]